MFDLWIDAYMLWTGLCLHGTNLAAALKWGLLISPGGVDLHDIIKEVGSSPNTRTVSKRSLWRDCQNR